MSWRPNRRGFLKTAAWGSAGWLLLRDGRSAFSYQANEKLDVALVGIGSRGRGFVNSIPRIGHNLVAVCDANQKRAAALTDTLNAIATVETTERNISDFL